MTTKLTIKQLEKQYYKINLKKHGYIHVVRNVNPEGLLIDKNGRILHNNEIKLIQKEDEEVSKQGGQIIYLTHYFSSIENG